MVTNRNKVIQVISENEGMTIAQIAHMIGKPPASLYDIQTGKIKGVSDKLADAILEKFPHYNKSWLVTGDGDMFKTQQSINGDGNVQVGGNASNVNDGTALNNAIKEIAHAHALMAKMQEQMDKLLNVIENLSSK